MMEGENRDILGISKHSYVPTFEERGDFSKTRHLEALQTRHLNKLSYITNSGQTPKISETRDINTPESRDMKIEIASAAEFTLSEANVRPRNDRIAQPFGCYSINDIWGSQPRNDKQGLSTIQYVPIVDVKPGDYVLSLNEETQKIEPRRINGLLDMGVKPVFKLTTASGKFIKTTGNHPYLTKDGWRKVIELAAGDEIAAPREINGRAWSDYDGQYRIRYLQIQAGLMLQLWQSFDFSFPGIYNYTANKENNAQYYKSNAQSNMQFFKKVTGKSYSQDSFAEISNIFSNKLPARFINDYHNFWKKVYHAFNNLSSHSWKSLSMRM